MYKDLCIEKIVNVYQQITKTWNRDVSKPRGFGGIVLFTKGKIRYDFADRSLVAQEGDLLLLPGNVAYSGQRLTEETGFYVLDFISTEQDAFAPTVIAGYQGLEAAFCQMVEHWEKQTIDGLFKIKSFAYGILGHAAAEPKGADRILELIARNLSDPTLSVAMLCSTLYISESQLRRNVLRATGLTPNGYILTLRLNRAKNLLIYSSDNIKQIAFQCGFSSPYYFSKCFTEKIGQTPTQYRKTAVSL